MNLFVLDNTIAVYKKQQINCCKYCISQTYSFCEIKIAPDF